MPRKPSASVRVAPHEVEDTITREEPLVLTLDERTALRAFFASVTFKKALHNARLKQPSVFTDILDSTLGSIVANNRLHEIRGWKMFEAAIGSQVEDPRPPSAKAPDDYARER